MSSRKPGSYYWQLIDNHGGLCGQVSVAAILHALDKHISVQKVVEDFTKYIRKGSPDITNATELAMLINYAYSDKLHAWYRDGVGIPNLLSARAWGGKEGVINSLRSEWLAQNTYVIAGININISFEANGRLSWGYNWGQEVNSKFAVQNVGSTGHPIGHWVVLTGVSYEWDRQSFNKYNRNPWQWVRIFNPFAGITEYYWWGDFTSSWDGTMIRVDQADSENTCYIGEGGQCWKYPWPESHQ